MKRDLVQHQHLLRLTCLHVFLFIMAVSLLVGCSTTKTLPVEAGNAVKEAAQNYYTSPWMGNTHFESLNEIKIERAWLAKNLDNIDNSGEMWCVDVSVSGQQTGSPKNLSATWIVARAEAQGQWQAAALETISASTTIERCTK